MSVSNRKAINLPKRNLSISRAPKAYQSLTETPIFVPTNQPDLPDVNHGGKNNEDTHPNSLRGRNDSSLTMITS
jgi:hypothetical protein